MLLDSRRIGAVAQAQHERRPFSGVVRVCTERQTLFAGAFGRADRAAAIDNSTETRFGTASGTKTFTALATLRLIEADRMSLETRLVDVIDAPLPHFDPSITIEHLLTHTSGAPDYFDETELDAQADFGAAFGELSPTDVRRPSDVLPLFARRPMRAAPGTRFSYNNGGYVLLGRVIELITGVDYADFVEQEVFARAGMADSGFFEMDRLPARTAVGYRPDGRPNTYELTGRGMPDGGAFVTAADMGRFWQALLGHRLLNPDTTAAFLRPQVAVSQCRDDGTHYGYGLWMTVAGSAVERYTCSGADPGVAFSSTWYPIPRIELTVLGNTDSDAWPMLGALDRLIRDDRA